MICMHMQPMNIVEDEGFRKFVNTIQPNYVIPSRKKVKNDIIELYESTKKHIYDGLQDCTALAVTVDHWTSTANEAYMAVTGHSLSDSFKVGDYCLNVSFMPESHTAENISKALQDCIKEWLPETE